MKTLRILATALALLQAGPVLALDRVLPAPRIKDNGDVRLSDDLKIGRYQGGKYIGTPDALTIQTLKAPLFSEAAGVLGRGIIFDSGGSVDTPTTFTMPANKQFDYMGWRQTIQQTGGSKVSWLDYDLIVNGGRADAPGVPGSNAYFHIGNITNNGPGTVAGSYSRVTIGTDNTGGNALAYKGGVTTRPGAGLTAGFQMNIDTTSAAKPVDYGYYLGTNNYGGFGYAPLNYGFLAAQNIRIEQALVQGFAGGAGDALRWLSVDGTTYLARIDKAGTASFTRLDIPNGPTLRSDRLTMPVQGVVSLPNANREFQLQSVDAGDRFRVIAGGVGEVISLDANQNLGVAGFTDRQGATKSILMPNGTCATAAPTGGGVLCVEGGALKYRGSSGTLTTIAPP
ncbi:hypothetical protein SAMN05192565_1152 [Methylobacterium gossipiicola]|uniref:Uncharacterized protein n=1 Tax=Methylobacterium gossipiicola TaxID=582675 RepID=A0A1I2VGH9_9HYPH|nr:hypothetical protein SAMN05192565_1152 [Methylobacterium gossipiicola]